MKLGQILMRTNRSPQSEYMVPFREQLPLTLRNHVSMKASSGSNAVCMHEITLLMSCLKENDYANERCSEQTKKFQNCFDEYMKNKSIMKKNKISGDIIPGSTEYSPKQISSLLRKYPHV